jgi:hypothetical protein
MKRYISQSLVFLTLITLIGWTAVSCKKEKKPNAIITVQDMNYNNMANANVLVYSSPNGSIVRDEISTNDAGQAIYEADNDCILNVKVTYTQSGQNLEGYGLIILKKGETYYETVYVN